MEKQRRSWIHYLPLYGCFSTGLIYIGIGVIAILSFFKIRNGGADEGSLVVLLNGHIIGKIFIWIILLGTICYILWRIFEAISDPYDYGREMKGMTMRLGIALSTIPDLLITYTVIEILLGVSGIKRNGQPKEEYEMVGAILHEGGGTWWIVAMGVAIMITAVVQLFYGFTRGYKERLDIDHCKVAVKRSIHFLGLYGYLSRGIILGIIGFSFIRAGVLQNAKSIVNTDKAFDFIGDHVGGVLFILVAVGTVCYGVFMFVFGYVYDVDKD